MPTSNEAKNTTQTTPKDFELRHETDSKIALWLGLALFFFYLLTTSIHPPYGDEMVYLFVAESIVFNGEPAISTVRRTDDGQTQNARLYFKLPLGQSLLLLPFVVLAFSISGALPLDPVFTFPMTINSLPALESAALCALLFLLIRLLGTVRSELYLSRPAAVIIALTTGLATQLWPASRTLFADNSGAFLLTLSIYCLVRLRYQDRNGGSAIAAAWAAAMMVLCKNTFLLACPALAAYGVWAIMQRKKEGPSLNKRLLYLVFACALPLVVAVAVQLCYNYFRYGSIWLFGYHLDRDGALGFSTPLLVGFYGIFLSSGRSLFLYSPPCLLAFLGARHFFKHAPAEAALITGAAAPVVLLLAKWWAWHGGAEWGTRFYLFMIPLLMWISIPAWRWLDQTATALVRRTRQISLAVLLAVSLFVQLLGLLVSAEAYWVMTIDRLKIFERQTYEKGIWEIRDELALFHFVPEFSPLAVHGWLAWATWNRARYDDNTLAENAPWYTFNPKWALPDVRPFLGFDIWFSADYLKEWQPLEGMLLEPSIFGRSSAERFEASKRLGNSMGSVIFIALLLLGGLSLSILKLRAALAEYSPRRV